ncbi:MAG: DUF288 domain-containing protein [Candidatus Doudnabacteria bacterium]|nr:DUF288 domain-containing protein [Candidatus Doudnabacteria bacterium]
MHNKKTIIRGEQASLTKNNWIIVTTINPATKGLLKFAQNKEYNLVIVGDKKSPSSYNLLAEYLNVEKQKDLFGDFSESLPYNHYSRKNLGYLFAINKGADIIAESDDDNIPYSSWGIVPKQEKFNFISSPRFPNVYKEFTKEFVWPRGLPLDLILSKDKNKKVKKAGEVLIWQGLADGSPDVDAIYRLVLGKNITFKKNAVLALNKQVVSAFNSQNTIWKKKAFPFLYLPHTVTFRYTDILRSFVAQFGIWQMNGHLGFLSPTVKQERNIHNLLRDFKDEVPMYNTFYEVVEILSNCVLKGEKNDLLIMYQALFEKGVVKEQELLSVRLWLNNFK